MTVTNMLYLRFLMTRASIGYLQMPYLIGNMAAETLALVCMICSGTGAAVGILYFLALSKLPQERYATWVEVKELHTCDSTDKLMERS